MNSTRPRTSITHPLQIATIEIGGGKIGVTFAPGKNDPWGMSGPWKRDMATDLGAIKTWGADIVVTLIEEHEFDRLDIPDLGKQVVKRGMEWLHAPIRDVDVPGPEFDAAWPETSERLHSMLAEGKGVLIHCRGGIGRASTIAGRLMVELGDDPRDAINLLRRIRHPTACETPEQERWVATGPRHAAPIVRR